MIDEWTRTLIKDQGEKVFSYIFREKEFKLYL